MTCTYGSSKTFGHEVGLSCCFRQWGADSHCAMLHGYAIAVRLEFEANTLDHRNWVVDFGGLKFIKGWLQETFDHTLLVAADDPQRGELMTLGKAGLAKVVMVDATGCEAFAVLIADKVMTWLAMNSLAPRVRLALVEVREHGANAATFRPTHQPDSYLVISPNEARVSRGLAPIGEPTP